MKPRVSSPDVLIAFKCTFGNRLFTPRPARFFVLLFCLVEIALFLSALLAPQSHLSIFRFFGSAPFPESGGPFRTSCRRFPFPDRCESQSLIWFTSHTHLLNGSLFPLDPLAVFAGKAFVPVRAEASIVLPSFMQKRTSLHAAGSTSSPSRS